MQVRLSQPVLAQGSQHGAISCLAVLQVIAHGRASLFLIPALDRVEYRLVFIEKPAHLDGGKGGFLSLAGDRTARDDSRPEHMEKLGKPWIVRRFGNGEMKSKIGFGGRLTTFGADAKCFERFDNFSCPGERRSAANPAASPSTAVLISSISINDETRARSTL